MAVLVPKAVAKKKSEAAKKTEPKKKVIADADTTPDSEAETSFINPMEAFGMNSPPVPKSKVKGRTVGSREIQKKDDTTSSHENGTAEAGYGFINPFKDMPNLGGNPQWWRCK